MAAACVSRLIAFCIVAILVAAPPPVKAAQSANTDAPLWAGKTWKIYDKFNWWHLDLEISPSGDKYKAELRNDQDMSRQIVCSGAVLANGDIETSNCDLPNKNWASRGLSGSLYKLEMSSGGGGFGGGTFVNTELLNYKKQTAEATPQIATAQAPAGLRYLGCFRDSGSPNGLTGRDVSGVMVDDDEMTTERCSSYCRKEGFRYAATQWSRQCFCGDSYGHYGQAINCDMKCSGDWNNVCGGDWANSVYDLRPGTATEQAADVSRTPAPVTTDLATAPSPPISQTAADSATWNEIQYSTDIADYQQYLEKFPNGLFVPLAEKKLRSLIAMAAQSDQPNDSEDQSMAGIDFGEYHALIIGINDYKHLPKLKSAINDARAVAATLELNYGFNVTLLIDPDRSDIIDAFDDYRTALGPQDNLLIYYAGHGWLDEESGRGYWLPRTAKSDRRSNWLSNATITDTLKVLLAKHIIVVADSCYSGTLTRAAPINLRDKDYFKRMASKSARVALVSGGLEPVADQGGGGNSPFAGAFITALKNNDRVIDGTKLFGLIRRPVMLAAKQTPRYSDVRDAGHDGGDFLFVRKQ